MPARSGCVRVPDMPEMNAHQCILRAARFKATASASQSHTGLAARSDIGTVTVFVAAAAAAHAELTVSSVSTLHRCAYLVAKPSWSQNCCKSTPSTPHSQRSTLRRCQPQAKSAPLPSRSAPRPPCVQSPTRPHTILMCSLTHPSPAARPCYNPHSCCCYSRLLLLLQPAIPAAAHVAAPGPAAQNDSLPNASRMFSKS